MRGLHAVLAALLLPASAVLIPAHSQVARGQTPPAATCSATPLPDAPMPGHYTGPWHAAGDYHFAVHFDPFNGYPASDYDLEIRLSLDGTLDTTVHADGTVTGSATGNADAEVYRNGVHDISSGIGTVSGQLAGAFSTTGSVLAVQRPVLDMHWGTFGGHAVETFPALPDIHFDTGSSGCVSAGGSLQESGWPTMNITNDSTGQLTQAAGVGTATGTWTLTSDRADAFQGLLDRVNAVLSSAQTALADPGLTVEATRTTIAGPLNTLEQQAASDPAIARCLLARIDAWRATEVPQLFARAHDLALSHTLSGLRQAGEMVRIAALLSGPCPADGSAATATIGTVGGAMLDTALLSRTWADAALVAREVLLAGGSGAQADLQARLTHDLHVLVTRRGAQLANVGRMAYAFGDDADATAVAATIKRHKKKKHSRPTPAQPPGVVLGSGVTAIRATRSGTSFAWQPLPGAVRYVVVALAADTLLPAWTWSGAATSVTYGDTAVEGLPDSAGETWPIPAGNLRWSVLALNDQGRIVGVVLRSSG